MVRDINRTQVRDTEVLSDNIYLYSPVSGKLTLIEKGRAAERRLQPQVRAPMICRRQLRQNVHKIVTI